MQKFRTITVADKHLGVAPNLEDYEKAYRDYDLAEWAKGEIEYFADGKLNAAYNAVERHAHNENKNKVALYLVDENLNETKITFFELNQLANRFGNYLKSLGVNHGDRVFFFLPRTAEIFYGFLGTLKIGAIAGTMFSAFGSDAIYDRLENSSAKVLVTTEELKPRLTSVRRKLPALEHVITTKRLAKVMSQHSDELHTSHTDPADPAFMLYTSGTTGKPKGVIHAHQAILQQHLTAKHVLDLKPEDVYWCTADPGWVTGIAYQILGTLSNATSTVVYSGRFDPKNWYKIIEKIPRDCLVLRPDRHPDASSRRGRPRPLPQPFFAPPLGQRRRTTEPTAPPLVKSCFQTRLPRHLVANRNRSHHDRQLSLSRHSCRLNG